MIKFALSSKFAMTEFFTKIRKAFIIIKNNSHVNALLKCLVMSLIIKQHSVMQMFEFRKTSEFMIIMCYYFHENIVNVDVVNENKRVIFFEQILNDFAHFHANEIMHRDLKFENFLIEMKSYFKILIFDFDLINVIIDNIKLIIFCETHKYVASKMFFF